MAISCSNPNDKIQYSILKLNDSIPVDENFVLFQSFTQKDSEYFSYWHVNELVIFKIKDQSNKIRISASVLGVDSFGALNSYYIHTLDSIFVLQEMRIGLLGANGKCLFSKRINPEDGREMYYNSVYQYPIYFNSANRSINVRRLNMTTHRFDSKYFDWYPDAYYLLDQDTFVYGKIRFPNKFLKHCYGDLHNYFKAVSPNYNVYSFEAEENIYVENLKTGEITTKEGRSTYQKKEIVDFNPKNRTSMDKMYHYINTNPVYLKIIYDPYRNLFYRFFWKENDEKDQNGNYTVYTEKQLFLMVFDSEFNLVLEKNLGRHYRWFYSFITSSGLYINKKMSNLEANYRMYDIFQIVKEN